MPSGANDGNSRCTMALKEPLRSEPQIERTFKVAITFSSLSIQHKGAHRDELRARSSDRAAHAASRNARPPLLLVLDGVYEHADALDVDLAGIALLHPHRVRLAGVTRSEERRVGNVSDSERVAYEH